MKKCMRRVCTQWGQNIRSMTHAESKNRHNYRLSRFIVFSDTLQISSGETIVSAKPNVGHRLLITDILAGWSHRHARCFWFPNEGNNFMWMNLENKGNVILNIPPCLEKKHLTAHKLSALYNAAPWEVNRRTAVKTSSTGGLSRLPPHIKSISDAAMHASVPCFKSQWWMAAWLQQISYLRRLRAQEATKTQTSKRSSKGRLHLKSGYVCLSHWIISSFLKHYTENHILPRACKTAVTTAGPPWIWNSTLSSPEKLRGADETNKGITTFFSYLNM